MVNLVLTRGDTMRRLRKIQAAAGASLVALGVAGAQPSPEPKADAQELPCAVGEAWVRAFGAERAGHLGAASFHHDHVLGTSLDLWVIAPGPSVAEAAERAALDEIERLRQVFSVYDPESELSRLNRAHGPVPASPDLLAVLRLYELWGPRSGGALNAQSGGLVRAWQEAEKAGREPAAERLKQIVREARGPGWEVVEASGAVTRLTAQPLDLNAIAKGYIIQRAAAAVREREQAVQGLLLNLGGDLVAWGRAGPGAAGWPVDVQDPLRPEENAPPLTRLEIQDRAVATSGGYQRGYTVGGTRHSHLLDPRAGRPAEGVAGATVVAADNVTANALATTLCVLPPDEGLRLVEATPGAECLLVAADGRQFRSPGLRALEGAAPRARAADAPAAARPKADGWPEGYRVSVAIELPNVKSARRYRRPYVAVWVEGANGKAVRTIAVWASRPKWFKDLTDWWKFAKDDPDLVRAVTRATRGPGQYEVVWDGKDDKGNPVPRGTYTVRVEVHREHGKHLRQSGKIACGAGPAKVTLTKNAETGDTVVEYGKKK
jgi:thiamine biosynthesis lipoprotein ApbE